MWKLLHLDADSWKHKRSMIRSYEITHECSECKVQWGRRVTQLEHTFWLEINEFHMWKMNQANQVPSATTSEVPIPKQGLNKGSLETICSAPLQFQGHSILQPGRLGSSKKNTNSWLSWNWRVFQTSSHLDHSLPAPAQSQCLPEQSEHTNYAAEKEGS